MRHVCQGFLKCIGFWSGSYGAYECSRHDDQRITTTALLVRVHGLSCVRHRVSSLGLGCRGLGFRFCRV